MDSSTIPRADASTAIAVPTDARRETPSQTAGPYVHIGLAPRAAGLERHPRELGGEVAGADVRGERIRVEGRVLDGTGAPVGDALIEVWQADADGRRADGEGGGSTGAGFRGWGRVVPDFDTGLWYLDTVKPGSTIGPDGLVRAPHVSLWIVARGVNVGLSTRLYFGDEAEANERDPVLALVEPDRRATLIAAPVGDAAVARYRFDVHLQGDRETVFFDV